MSGDWADYELLDFGEGRKLERFGTWAPNKEPWVVDRPAPNATGKKQVPAETWRDVTARYSGERSAAGKWKLDPSANEWGAGVVDVSFDVGTPWRMQLTAQPSGQVGIFPEQLANWKWLAQQTSRCTTPPNVLNLFAYTGASTLAVVSTGASVTHVDAAKSAVDHARSNAAMSGFDEKPVRWIVDDVLKFTKRERRRGNRYDAIILDPPTYGHGPKGEEWQIKRDLLPLLELCGELVERRPKFVLLSCHTPGIGPAELSAYLAEGIFGHCGQPPRTGELALTTADGRRLPSGVFARWPG